MKRLFAYFFILAVAIWLGLVLQAHAGYLLLAYNHWSVEMPLWFALVSIVILFFIFYYALRLLHIIGASPARFSHWRAQANAQKANQETEKALIYWIEGEAAKAEKLFKQSAKYSPCPLFNYLGAAFAAQAQKALARRDDYLSAACQRRADLEMPVSLVKAHLQQEQKQWELALLTLKHLQTLVPKNKRVLLLLQNIYKQLSDWSSLEELLPALHKTRALPPETEIVLHETLYAENLRQAKTLDQLQKAWRAVPAASRANIALLAHYAKRLLAFQEADETVDLLSNYLPKLWHEELVLLYGYAESTRAEKQLRTAESWLKLHKHDATLYHSLALIATHFKYWSKALEYAQMSLNLKPTVYTHMLLGYIYDELGETQQATKHYRQGFLYATKNITLS